MSNRIDRCFERLASQGRKALIPFVTTGDPHPEWTVPIMHAMVGAGADVIELGVPFSDPMADGPVIQEASERAISKGVSLTSVIEAVADFRKDDADTPVVLMGYLNPIERLGAAQFAAHAAQAGVDGVLIVDCPPEEMAAMRAPLDQNGIHSISLVAPTSTDARIRMIAEQASGYIYYVSFKGITGANRLDESTLSDPIRRIRSESDLPVAVGFGIKSPESASAVAGVADAVVIGSALIEEMKDSESVEQAMQSAEHFLAPIRRAMDNSV